MRQARHACRLYTAFSDGSCSFTYLVGKDPTDTLDPYGPTEVRPLPGSADAVCKLVLSEQSRAALAPQCS